jgi:hypothetical protein
MEDGHVEEGGRICGEGLAGGEMPQGVESLSQEVPAIALEDVEPGLGCHVLKWEGLLEGLEDGRDELLGGIGEEVVFLGSQVESFGAEGCREDRGFAGEGFEDFQACAATHTQGNEQESTGGQERSNVRDIRDEVDTGKGGALLTQPAGWPTAYDRQTRLGCTGEHGRKNLLQQQTDGIEIGPPVQTAQKEQVIRVAFHIPLRSKDIDIHAVVHHGHRSMGELFPDSLGIGVTDSDGKGGVGIGPLFKAVVFGLLLADVPTFEGLLFDVGQALPDEGFDVVGHDGPAKLGQLCSEGGTQDVGIGGPFAVPQVHGVTLGEVSDRLDISGCGVEGHGIGEGGKEIAGQAGVESRPRFGRERTFQYDGADA